jgi:hypothetical protein
MLLLLRVRLHLLLFLLHLVLPHADINVLGTNLYVGYEYFGLNCMFPVVQSTISMQRVDGADAACCVSSIEPAGLSGVATCMAPVELYGDCTQQLCTC